MNTDLLRCCQQAELDGFEDHGHFPVCDARREEYPSHPVIDVWAVLRDPDIPAEVGQRLLNRQRAARNGEQPDPCPESDKPFLARHIVSPDSSDRSLTEVPDDRA